MDTYSLLVLLHVIGTILGTGGATIAELQITRALRDKQVSPDERALMHVNYGMIRVGMGILLVSVIGMFWYFALQGSYTLFTSNKLWIKELMFLVIFLNAIAIQRRWVPLWLGASTSFTSWWGATLLGLAGELPYAFTTYLIGYVLAIFAIAGLLHWLRHLGARGWLAGQRITLVVITLIAILLLTVILLVYSEHTARNVSRELTHTTPVVQERTLSETVSFDYPGGSHTIAFTVTTDASGSILSLTAADIDPANQGRIADFATEVSAMIVGQSLSTVVPLARVGGASLTTAAFNEAVIRMQARIN